MSYNRRAQLRQEYIRRINRVLDYVRENLAGDLRLETLLSRDGEQVLLRFRDTGPGLSSEPIANLFEPFYTTKSDGTGLGLAISYGIIERHGGEIEVSSQSAGGATFVIKLPVRQAGTQGRMAL